MSSKITLPVKYIIQTRDNSNAVLGGVFTIINFSFCVNLTGKLRRAHKRFLTPSEFCPFVLFCRYCEACNTSSNKIRNQNKIAKFSVENSLQLKTSLKNQQNKRKQEKPPKKEEWNDCHTIMDGVREPRPNMPDLVNNELRNLCQKIPETLVKLYFIS